MASTAHSMLTPVKADGWIKHHGQGRPLPNGMKVEVEMFCGVRRIISIGAATHDPEGTPIPAAQSAGWSSWVFDDGGPMGPKFKAYRLAPATDYTALFNSWLDVPADEMAVA